VCYQKITCQHCSSFNLKKNGKTGNKKQKYQCKDCRRQFITNYSYQGCRSFIRSLIVPMTLNSSGIRDISRVLSISTQTVLKVIHQAARQVPALHPPAKARTIELDEFWSFVQNKSNQRWTWLGLTSSTGRIGAVVNGRRTDKNCRQLLESYRNSHIGEFASDQWQSYPKYLPADLHYIGKDKTQRIERTNLNFRLHLKRLQRKTITFSKNDEMHDAVINLYVHHHNFRRHKL
jgi:IS1 family transposase/transposase-like protein